MKVFSWKAALFFCLATAPLAGQEKARDDEFALTVRSGKEISADPGSVITVVVSVENRGANSLTLTPSIGLPDRWLLATGGAPFSLAGSAGDVWLLGVNIPPGVAAGRYVLGIAARSAQAEGRVGADSVIVQVRKRSQLSLVPSGAPPYGINGESYQTEFLLQNRGNSAVTVRLSASSALDPAPRVDKSVARLGAGEATIVKVSITARAAQSAGADVVELRAFDETIRNDPVTASSLVTMVDRPGAGEPLITLPAVLKIRGAAAGTEVAPYEFSGGGRIREGGDEQVDFLFRGKTPSSSPFGEREEYRVALRSPHVGAKLGDNYYALSPLTGAGQTGFGGGLELSAGPFGAGGYSQRFRFLPGNQVESGAFLRLRPPGALSAVSITINGVERVGGLLAGRVVSPSLTIRAPFATTLEVEGASSTARVGNGRAESVRLSGGERLRFDLSHLRGDSLFAGPVRGVRDDYGNTSLLLVGKLRVTGTGSLTRYQPLRGPNGFIQGFATLGGGLRYGDRVALEYATVSRVDSLSPGRIGPAQRLVRGRIDQPWPFGNVWISAETGQRLDSTARGAYHQVLAGARAAAAGSWISAFAEYYDGGALMRGPVAMTTVGGSASLRLTPWNTLDVYGYGARTKSFREQTATQVDARFTQAFFRGSTLSVRARYSAFVPFYRRETLFYTEFQIPLGLPMGRIHTPGRISGRVTDAETGQGLSGALVRLGPRAAVTDKNGVATFTGLPPGEYRVSLASEAKLSNAAIRGDPVVNVGSNAREVSTFSLQVAPASTVRGTVRQYGIAQTSLTARPDSIVDNGPLQGVTIALINGADTLYHISDAEGKFSFTEISAGVWSVQVIGDVPPSMVYEHSQFSVATAAGEQVSVEFRLVPKKRPVILDEPIPPLSVETQLPPKHN